MRARAPASSANLGPGFDVLALALSAYVEVSVEPAPRLAVRATGHGADLPADASHLAARVAAQVIGHDRLSIEVDSDIPVGRGLGSSAALAVAAAAAAGADDPFRYGVEVDGHPENAAASAFGGLVAATVVGERPVYRKLPLDPDLSFVVLIPEREVLTAAARTVLPQQVSRDDAVFNLGRLSLLLTGLADHSQLLPEAGDDRLHQDARAAVFPEAPALLTGLREAGALMACWSGAGPSLLAVCERASAPRLAEAAEALLEANGVSGGVRRLQPDQAGVTVSRRWGK
jgi:homoserine kinase